MLQELVYGVIGAGVGIALGFAIAWFIRAICR